MRQIRRFQAESVTDALARVRAELGSDAVILETRLVKSGGLFGLFGRRLVEVTASGKLAERKPALTATRMPAPLAPPPPVPPAALPAPPAPHAPPAPPPPPPAPSRQATPPAASVPPPAPPALRAAVPTPPRRPEEPDDLVAVRRELDRVTALVERVARVREHPARISRMDPVVRDVYADLVGAGVDPDLAAGLSARLQRRLRRGAEADGIRSLAQRLLTADLGTPCPLELRAGERRVITLVGPTGVGKTTTLAKLAARFALAGGWRVGLITADTYRIAAVEQLRTYCEIIGVPLEVLQQPDDATGALSRLRDCHLVLVDTAGRNHRRPEQMANLAAYLHHLCPDVVFLVLALNTCASDALAAATAYARLGYDRLLLTKLDECVTPGLAYTLVSRLHKPLSYITTGQNVPDDIEEVRPEQLSRLLLDGQP